MTRRKKRKGWKHKTDNKLRGSYGETDYEKKVIRVNKKLHKRKAQKGIPEKDHTILNTIVHELMHKNHPSMFEKTVRKETRKKVRRMSAAQKKKAYAIFS